MAATQAAISNGMQKCTFFTEDMFCNICRQILIDIYPV
jgi:hypothetical protein